MGAHRSRRHGRAAVAGSIGLGSPRMPRHLEHKQRVKADADLPVPEPRAPRAWLLWLGAAAAWVVAATAAIMISEHWWPGWFQGDEDPDESVPVTEPALPVGSTSPRGVVSTLGPTRRGPRAWTPIYRGVQPSGDSTLPLATESATAAAAPVPSGCAAVTGSPPTTCEGAVAVHRAGVVQGRHLGPARVTAGRHQAELDNGSYLATCGVPEDMAITVCAAIQRGRALGVTVHTTPTRPTVQRCIADAVRKVEFTSEAQLDVTKSHFYPL